MKTPSICSLLLLSAFAISCGCSSPRSQVAQVQKEKEQLIQAIKEQKQELDDLKSRNQVLASQLNEAELEIARGPTYGGDRRLAAKSLEKESSKPATAEPASVTNKQQLADKSLTKPATETKPAGSHMTPSKLLTVPSASDTDSKLAWKPTRTEGAATSTAGATSLKQWAAQRAWLKFDEAAQAVVALTPLDLAADGKSLGTETRTKLDELATLLKSGEGKNLRVMVAGAAPKASNSGVPLGSTPADAVAAYLDKQGLARDRVGVTATGAETSSPRLAIYVLPGDTPVIGWTPPDTIRR